jgi:hypothetical protein
MPTAAVELVVAGAVDAGVVVVVVEAAVAADAEAVVASP